jgi:hypothetical protein
MQRRYYSNDQALGVGRVGGRPASRGLQYPLVAHCGARLDILQGKKPARCFTKQHNIE